MDERERPDAGEEWVAKALLIGGQLKQDRGYGGYMLWAASIPGEDKEYYGVTQALACRKLVRAITGGNG